MSKSSKSNTLSQNMVASRTIKRKGSTFSQSPWHKVYQNDSELSYNISISEQKWSLVTNTLCEKVDSYESISPSKKRLVLSTNLMQQLLQPAPKFVFSDNNVALNYETVLYFVSRINLADSCSLKYNFKSINCQTSETVCDQVQSYFKLVNGLMEKIQKLECDFQRLERATSILDIILEIQDTERFSVINHLGKFHGYTKTKTRPVQRYVVGKQMPISLLEPLDCLSL